MRSQRGFSLIELLVVVAIFLIIMAIAIPSFLHSRMRANEADAVAALRVIHTASTTYSTTYPALGFPATLASLGGANPCTPAPATACLIDNVLALGSKSGYTLVWIGDGLTPSYGFTLSATPQAVGSTGQNMYCTDQTGVVRFDPTGAGCTSASSALN